MTPTLVLARVLCAAVLWMPVTSSSRPAADEREADGNSEQAERVYRICRVTAYCDRGTTASGVESGVGQCAAPGDIPFGSIVYIAELDRSFVVTDRTARRFRKNTVDIFISSREECLEFGRSYLECEFIIKPRASKLRATSSLPNE